jgi:membrane protein
MARQTGSHGKRHAAGPPTARTRRGPEELTGIPRAGWLAILKRSIREFKHDDITDRAAALTYFGVLALFPAMLVLVSILGLLGKSTTQQVLTNIDQIAPAGCTPSCRASSPRCGARRAWPESPGSSAS